MAWRLLMRRSPSRSMTLVGDVAQTSELAGAASWESVLSPYVAQRWRREELTVNYRTPLEIMRLAGRVLIEIDPVLVPPASVRESGVSPWLRAGDVDVVAAAVREELGHLGDGRLAVIAPAARVDELGKAVVDVEPSAAVGDDLDLRGRVSVLTVRQAKGLEFDSVILVDPGQIVAESPRGHNDLYVALTRATQRLGIVHADPLPAYLAA